MNKKGLISIVAPAYNEETNIESFYKRIDEIFKTIEYDYEIIFVNDGSVDNTANVIKPLNVKDNRVKLVNLSRNFGKEIALSAGIDYINGDAAVIIDVDLQDPPEIIPEFIEKYEQGYDVVYATRTKREGETFVKRATAHVFYRIMRRMSKIDIPKDTGDFRLISKKVVLALRELKEQQRFMKGMFSWVGFKSIGISYVREPRLSGKTTFNYWKLWNFAIEGITSFSFAPLQVATYLGFAIAGFTALYAIFLFIRTLFYGNNVPGYPSIMVTMLFLGGVQLITLGIIGEYVGRIYNESKRRPLYFVQDTVGFDKSKKVFRFRK